MNKQKLTVVILWCITAVLLIGGLVMLGIGLRSLASAFAEALSGSFDGSGGGILDFAPDATMLRLSVAGGVLAVAGVIFFFVASAKQKELSKHPRTDAETQLQVQTILREMGLDAEGNRVASQSTAARYCVRCGKPIERADYAFCPYCGAKAAPVEENDLPEPAEEGPRKCMYCGKVLQKEEEVCSVCGHKVNRE